MLQQIDTQTNGTSMVSSNLKGQEENKETLSDKLKDFDRSPSMA